MRTVCQEQEVGILKGAAARDHVHLFLSIPPRLAISRLVQLLKGRSAHMLLEEHPELRPQLSSAHLWARGYFCRSSGNVTDAMIMAFLEKQIREDESDY